MLLQRRRWPTQQRVSGFTNAQQTCRRANTSPQVASIVDKIMRNIKSTETRLSDTQR
jgi:hypothetical protein